MYSRFAIVFMSLLTLCPPSGALEMEMITTSATPSSSSITPDKGTITKYVSGTTESQDSPMARRGNKVFESNEQSFKWGRPTAALALSLMVLGLVFLVRFMRRRTLRAKA